MFPNMFVFSEPAPVSTMFGTTPTPADRVGRTMPERTLDVREVDGEPFGRIVDELETLTETETLVLINSFEPEPLYTVLDQRGFDHETEQVAEEKWRVEIHHA